MTTLHFSTDEFPEQDRIEIAQSYYESLSKVTISPLEDATLSASARFSLLPGASVAAVERSPMAVDRSSYQASQENDNIALFVNCSGNSHITLHDSETASYGAGQAFIAPTTSAGKAMPSSHGIDIVLPRQALEGPILNLDRKLNQVLPDTAALRLLTRYAVNLTREEFTLPSELQHLSSRHLTDLFINLLGGTPDAAHLADQRGVRAARLLSIKHFIGRNLTQPQLSAGLVAQHHQISERYLRALFAEEHIRFTDYVMDQRLRRAYQCLTDPKLSHTTISAIALNCGFDDLSWFNRSFKRKYQFTPSDVRNMHSRSGQ